MITQEKIILKTIEL